MLAPIKPKRPSKPIVPNKNQKVNTHYLDAESLLFKRTYLMSDDNGDEIEVSKEDFEYGRGYIQIESLTPTLDDFMRLAPGIYPHRIHFKLDTMYSEGVQEGDILQSVEVYFTTPFDYKEALKAYRTAQIQYERDLEHYTDILLPQYQKELRLYKKQKEENQIAKKKALLESQLTDLNKKTIGKKK